jgi:hypothetical protein
MVVQYPHILKFDIVTGGSEEIDENGDTVIVPGATTTIEVKCRFEFNTFGEMIVSADGANLHFGWVVFMPIGQPEIVNGTTIEGYNDDRPLTNARGEVKRYVKGQMNARLWI